MHAKIVCKEFKHIMIRQIVATHGVIFTTVALLVPICAILATNVVQRKVMPITWHSHTCRFHCTNCPNICTREFTPVLLHHRKDAVNWLPQSSIVNIVNIDTTIARSTNTVVEYHSNDFGKKLSFRRLNQCVTLLTNAFNVSLVVLVGIPAIIFPTSGMCRSSGRLGLARGSMASFPASCPIIVIARFAGLVVGRGRMPS
mmetsp:Transcript_10310/g.17474  ORF Transcript_10310/g.17474 Transcript_10310/m.17474 type:complete len:200 (-) Transcript_10310:336-935(-)